MGWESQGSKRSAMNESSAKRGSYVSPSNGTDANCGMSDCYVSNASNGY